jgi:hypothetical protein
MTKYIIKQYNNNNTTVSIYSPISIITLTKCQYIHNYKHIPYKLIIIRKRTKQSLLQINV